MDLAFRQAEPRDIATLLAFVQELDASNHIPFDERRTRAALERLVGDPSLGHAWVMIDAGEAIGYVVLTFGYSLEYGGRDAFVDELFVRADWRRRGAGTEALRFVEAACRDLGIWALHLEVERDNTAAQSVYRRAGFVDHDRYLITKRIPS